MMTQTLLVCLSGGTPQPAESIYILSSDDEEEEEKKSGVVSPGTTSSSAELMVNVLVMGSARLHHTHTHTPRLLPVSRCFNVCVGSRV